MPAQATAVVAAAGSFAAISTLLGSPIVGAFLLMEASGLGGPMLGVVLLPGLLASGVGALMFVGLDALDRARHVFPVDTWPAAFHPARHRRIRLGPGGRGRGGHRGHRDPAARPAYPAPRRAADTAADAGRGPAHRGTGDRLPRGNGEELLRSALLRAIRASAPDHPCGQLFGRRAPPAAGVQGACLWRVTEQFPWRPGLPFAVSWRGGRHRALPPARPPAGARRGDGDWRDVRRHAPASADLGAAGDPAAIFRRDCRHAAGDRGGCRGVRGVGQAGPGTQPRLRGQPQRRPRHPRSPRRFRRRSRPRRTFAAPGAPDQGSGPKGTP